MQCIVVKRGEFENSYSLLHILLKSCLCSARSLRSLRSNYVQYIRFVSSLKMTRSAHAYVPGVNILLLMVELISQVGTRLYRSSNDSFFGQQDYFFSNQHEIFGGNDFQEQILKVAPQKTWYLQKSQQTFFSLTSQDMSVQKELTKEINWLGKSVVE